MLVKNINPFVTYVDSTFILPGINNIPAAKAKQLVKSPAFQQKVKIGALVIINSDGEENSEVKSHPGALPILANKIAKTNITKMSVTAAIKVIKEMYDVTELRELAKTEDRRTVKLAIKTQLKNIDNAVKKKEDDEHNDTDVYEE